MNKLLTLGIAAVLTAALTVPAALAQSSTKKHDSNTLRKIGKAVAYPVRKAGENTSKAARKTGKAVQYPVRKAGEHASIAAHRATGKNSVVRSRKTGKSKIVTPSGAVKPVGHH